MCWQCGKQSPTVLAKWSNDHLQNLSNIDGMMDDKIFANAH